MTRPEVILDTNIFIAAGFKPASDSARLVHAVDQGEVRMIWCEATRRETERLMEKIPPLSWGSVRHLFDKADRASDPEDSSQFSSVPDPEDRKFAALAAASGAVLISLDRDLLDSEDDGRFEVCTPSQFLRETGGSRIHRPE